MITQITTRFKQHIMPQYNGRIVKLFTLMVWVFLSSCSGLKGYQKVKVAEQRSTGIAMPVGVDYSSVVYKTQMDAFGRHFSGLLLFKPVKEDSSFRVVMLSEFGLNLMDLSLNNHQTTVISCQDFLNRRVIINAIEGNVRMLTFEPQFNKLTRYQHKLNETYAIKLKKNVVRYIYQYNHEGRITQIDKRTGFWNRLTVKLNYRENSLPDLITIESRPVKHRTKFTLLNFKE